MLHEELGDQPELRERFEREARALFGLDHPNILHVTDFGIVDGNPYLAIAAALASGLYGIENKLELNNPIPGNAYEAKLPKESKLPETLWDAAQRLKASKPARDWFGDAFVEHFAATREWEEREARKQITDWQLSRYFEII